MSLRSIALAGCASVMLVTSPALAEGIDSPTSSDAADISTEAGTGRQGFSGRRYSSGITSMPGGRVTSRRSFGIPAVNFGRGVTPRGAGGAAPGGEDGNGSSGSSH